MKSGLKEKTHIEFGRYRGRRTLLPLLLGMVIALLSLGAVGGIYLLTQGVDSLPDLSLWAEKTASAPPTHPGVDEVLPVETPEPTPTPPPLPTYDFAQSVPQSDPVEADYFADAVFLGDSRTDGLRLYGGIEDATFLCYRSLMVYHATGTSGVEAKAIPANGVGETATILEHLEEGTYGKVYIMFGINELGFKDEAGFAQAFSLLVDEIRTRQPQAVIYLQSLVPINTQSIAKTGKSDWLNNQNIALYNETLQQVALEKQVLYLDVQTALVDETGELLTQNTTDGIHFTRDWYQTWTAYLIDHTVDDALYHRGA